MHTYRYFSNYKYAYIRELKHESTIHILEIEENINCALFFQKKIFFFTYVFKTTNIKKFK